MFIGIGLGVTAGRGGDDAGLSGADGLNFQRDRYRLNGVGYASLMAVPGVTYSREGTATAFRADGTLAEFAPNVPRITDKGVLIEGQRTNLFARWDPTAAQIATKNKCADATAPAVAPLAGRNWIALDNTAGVAYAYHPAVVPPAQVVTASVLVETADGSQPVAGPAGVGDFSFVVSAVGGQLSAATFSYVRKTGNVWLVSATGTTGTTNLTAAGINRAPAQNQRPLKFSGFQLEEASTPSSPIITTGAAATRGADNLALVLPAGVTSYSAEYGDNLTATGPATPGPFDLATGRPWLNSVLRRITFS